MSARWRGNARAGLKGAEGREGRHPYCAAGAGQHRSCSRAAAVAAACAAVHTGGLYQPLVFICELIDRSPAHVRAPQSSAQTMGEAEPASDRRSVRSPCGAQFSGGIRTARAGRGPHGRGGWPALMHGPAMRGWIQLSPQSPRHPAGGPRSQSSQASARTGLRAGVCVCRSALTSNSGDQRWVCATLRDTRRHLASTAPAPVPPGPAACAPHSGH
jgi:hypothetical protein